MNGDKRVRTIVFARKKLAQFELVEFMNQAIVFGYHFFLRLRAARGIAFFRSQLLQCAKTIVSLSPATMKMSEQKQSWRSRGRARQRAGRVRYATCAWERVSSSRARFRGEKLFRLPSSDQGGRERSFRDNSRRF